MLAVLIAGAAAGILSAPHCALMCGPIAAYSTASRSGGTARYQLGRGLGYAAAGSFAGLMGQPLVALLWDSKATTALSWALALVMALAAFRAWPRSRKNENVAKSESQGEQGLVQITSRRDQEATKASWVLTILRRFPARPGLLGGLSVLIPCGALWGGLVLAASSGSPLSGGLAMIAFSLTSGTGLLASSLLSRKLRKSAGHHRALSLVFAAGAIILVLRPIGMHAPTQAPDSQSDASSVHCPLHPGGMP